MRSLFVLYRKDTDEWCSSSKHSQWGPFEDAAIFLSRKNAEVGLKAVIDRSGSYTAQ
jgi:hypothetical protein